MLIETYKQNTSGIYQTSGHRWHVSHIWARKHTTTWEFRTHQLKLILISTPTLCVVQTKLLSAGVGEGMGGGTLGEQEVKAPVEWQWCNWAVAQLELTVKHCLLVPIQHWSLTGCFQFRYCERLTCNCDSPVLSQEYLQCLQQPVIYYDHCSHNEFMWLQRKSVHRRVFLQRHYHRACKPIKSTASNTVSQKIKLLYMMISSTISDGAF
jgi:hypothetical protein